MLPPHTDLELATRGNLIQTYQDPNRNCETSDLDSALRNDATFDVEQDDVFGRMRVLSDLDRTSRPGQPLVVLEVRFFGHAPDDWRQFVSFSEAEEYANDVDRLVNDAVRQAEADVQVSAQDSVFHAMAQSARWGRVSELSDSTAAEMRSYVEESAGRAPSDYLRESIAALTPGYLLARGLPDAVVSNARSVHLHDGGPALARHQLAQQINACDLQLLINLRQMLEQWHAQPGIIRLVDLVLQNVDSGRGVPSVLELLVAAVREPVLRATPPGWYIPVLAANALGLNLTILQPGQHPWQLRPGTPPLYLEYDGDQYLAAHPPQHDGSVTAAQPPTEYHTSHATSTGPHLPPPPPEQELFGLP